MSRVAIELLENGEVFFPSVMAAIRAAREEVLIETFILAPDDVGYGLHRELIAAAARGVQVQLTVDDYGSNLLPQQFIDPLVHAGVVVHRYAPAPTMLGFRTNLFRRLHRKMVIVDGQVGFIGGINFSSEHLRSYGPHSKQDYAARVEGPVVTHMRRVARQLLPDGPAQHATVMQRLRRRALPRVHGLKLVTRDNVLHRTDIERHYFSALQAARRSVLIANAYFFPSYGLLRALSQAARRGVRVQLLLQGRPDNALAAFAAHNLYDYLLRGGVEIYEFTERAFHGKVAVIDEDWATIGSSNLDPLSLSLNLEANLVVRDVTFAAQLRGNLESLIAAHSRQVQARSKQSPRSIEHMLGALAFHLTRRFPDWAGQLPGHAPRPTQTAVSTLAHEGALK